ncbi:MAG: PAS domain-containing protein, partial [Ilumatobacteraceae bacterium]
MSEIVTEVDTPADVDVFDLAAVGMLITDPQCRVVRANPAFCNLLRRSADELLGASLASLAGPTDVSLSHGALTELLRRPGATARFEQSFLRPDGSSVWVDMSIRSFTAGHDR